ncbi:unnamed protein product [Heligmosomoides polygyrus]|uniref:Furin-like_2 domain-containing protein n=1 Tax=Heligmosomoides polygyrus TaxID=6339 RepID=A0A183FFD3_HELPZ|nr:unnamed protein product [Heligmosomoides polygyrus]
MLIDCCSSIDSHLECNVVDEVEPFSFGDLRSVGDCHPECDGGCSESQSAVACFRCKHFTQTLRNKAGNGFKCVPHCDDTYYLDGTNCKMCSSHCHTCSQAEVAISFSFRKVFPGPR